MVAETRAKAHLSNSIQAGSQLGETIKYRVRTHCMECTRLPWWVAAMGRKLTKLFANYIDSTGYQYHKGTYTKPVPEMERSMTPSQRFALGAGIEKAKVIQVRGFSKVAEVDFDAENYKMEEVAPEEIPDEFDWNTQQNIPIKEEWKQMSVE